MRITGKKTSVPRAKRVPAVAYSILAAISILLFTLSIQATTISNTLFTANAVELVAAFVLGSLLLKETINKAKLLAIILALAGLALYSSALISGNIGVIYGLLAGSVTAICNLLAKQLKGVDLNATLRMQFGIGAIFMSVLTLIVSPTDIIRTVSIESIAVTVIFALVLIFATRLVLYGFQHFDVNVASVVLSSQLVFGALLGYFIYREIPLTNELISGVLIACAATIGSLGYKRSAKEIDSHS